ncbi:peptidoglycan editing factor PgeF [Ornithinibacillus gellani]|uniref:peptidoglycan editing factor PgeF n=1 Tax=Ornithinibacillus gellani TaxID=2293253 RepID=UPI000F4817CE|nr:peptidoglycan editing factor PgeF [Ornithinibacillus gellani]TQS75643.1 peptidoglycan editing factor PgeF [Ornithinibacillus gellani]
MGDIFEQKDASFLQLTSWQQLQPRLRVGFTTRRAGYSQGVFTSMNMGLHVADHQEHVLQNRRKLANSLGLALDTWVAGEQTHGVRVKVVGDEDKGKGATTVETTLKDTDGLMTNQTGILCTAFYADCTPIFFFDPPTGYIGIAHAGWKGTVGNIAGEMVATLQEKGVDPSTIKVAIGPCITKPHYRVDNHVISHLSESEKQKTTEKMGENQYLLDLKALNVENLLQTGVLRHNIDITSFCTFADHDLFFSHRRDQGQTGRMLGFIGYI